MAHFNNWLNLHGIQALICASCPIPSTMFKHSMLTVLNLIFMWTYYRLHHSRSNFELQERFCSRRGCTKCFVFNPSLANKTTRSWGRHWRPAGADEHSAHTKPGFGWNTIELPLGSLCVGREATPWPFPAVGCSVCWLWWHCSSRHWRQCLSQPVTYQGCQFKFIFLMELMNWISDEPEVLCLCPGAFWSPPGYLNYVWPW